MTDHSCGAPHSCGGHHCGTSHDHGAGASGHDTGAHGHPPEGTDASAWMLTTLALTTLNSGCAEPASAKPQPALARTGSGTLVGWVLWVLAALVFAATWFAVS